MNKRGQYATWETLEYVLLVILILFFSVVMVRGIEDKQLNQIKSEGLALTISSVFLIDGEMDVNYDLGKFDHNVKMDNQDLELSKRTSDPEKIGRSKITLGEASFPGRFNKKTNNVLIEKKGGSVLLS